LTTKESNLSYLVLARKWRPTTFDEVVGQAHVTRTLVNAVQSGRVGHAYLFSGPRGVGKTTTARLLAKSLNCPNAKGAIPCNDCDVCREITAGISLDVIEIDAASNRGIDEIRNLRENVKYAPAGGKYKVYVVDEVHMLTDAAFNALLKTLEEPPPHVKFILATTAPLKVPETILSRCQRFEFVRIPARDVFTRLKHICSKEGFKVKDEVLMLLSRRANGSLRDAESMLDQFISAGLEEADEPDVAQLLGLSGAETFFSVIDAVQAKDAKRALEVLGSLFDRGANLDEFTDGLLEHLRNLLLIKIHPDLASLVEASSGHVKRYEEQATKFGEGDILRLINIASRASFSVRRSALPRLHLEMAIVEMSYLDSTTQLSVLIKKLESLEASLSNQSRASGRAASQPVPSEIDAAQTGDSAARLVPLKTDTALADEAAGTLAKTARTIGKAEGAIARPSPTLQAVSGAETGSSATEPGETDRTETDGAETDRTEARRVETGRAGPAEAERTETAAAEPRQAETDRAERPPGSIPAQPSRTKSDGPSSIESDKRSRKESVPTGPSEPGTRGVEVTAESSQKWNEVLHRINSRKKTLGVCLSAARFRGISQGKVILSFREAKSFEQSIVEDKVNKKILQEELAAVFKATLGVNCVRIEAESEETSEESLATETGFDKTKSTVDDSLKTILEYFDGEIIED
jgi:DNA polymerase-3 subunit gamma/tau